VSQDISPRVLEILERNYAVSSEIEATPDGSQLCASWLPDLPGCVGQGPTVADAQARLMELLPAYIEELLNQNVEIPEPSPPTVQIQAMGFFDQTGAPPELKLAAEAPAPQDGAESSSLVAA